MLHDALLFKSTDINADIITVVRLTLAALIVKTDNYISYRVRFEVGGCRYRSSILSIAQCARQHLNNCSHYRFRVQPKACILTRPVRVRELGLAYWVTCAA